MLLYVPWFFDPGMPSFASPERLRGFAFDYSDSLGTSVYFRFRGSIAPAHTCRYRRFTLHLTMSGARLAVKVGG